MSTTFRLFKSCSTVATVCGNRTGTRPVTLSRPHDPTRGPAFRFRPPSVVNAWLTSALCFFGCVLTGFAAQKACKRGVYTASSTSHYTTTSQLPETDVAFSSSTRTLPNVNKLRSLYTHPSQRTHSTSSTLSGLTSTSTSLEGSHSGIYPAFTNETSEELASHLKKTFRGTLVFPPELATRLLIHASHPASKLVGHNKRFAFTGEYTCVFLLSSSLPASYCASIYSELRRR